MRRTSTVLPLPASFAGHDPAQQAVIVAELAEQQRLVDALREQGREGEMHIDMHGALRVVGASNFAVFGTRAWSLFCQRLEVAGEGSITDYVPVRLADGGLVEASCDGVASGVLHLLRHVRLNGHDLAADDLRARWQAHFIDTGCRLATELAG